MIHVCFVLFVPSHCLESYIFSGHSSVQSLNLFLYILSVFDAGLQSVMEGGSDTFVTKIYEDDDIL